MPLPAAYFELGFRHIVSPQATDHLAFLLALTALLTPAAALLPHEIQRLAAMPMGLSLAWLGYALWSEKRGKDGGSLLAAAQGPVSATR